MAPWLGGYRVTHLYDPAGNRLVKNESGALTTYAYDPAAQLETAVDAAGVTTYSYDAAGNQLLEVSPAGRTTYSWTAENLLAGIATPDGTLVENLYNADFRRVSRNTSGPQGAETTKFLWDLPEDNVLAELDGAGEISAHYATEPALYGSILAQTRLGGSPATSFLHHDAIGSTLAATDLAQAIAANYAYTAFGLRTQSSGNLTLPFQYVGQAGYYTDWALSAAGIQLPYIRRRWYRPSTIRWLSVDPFVVDIYPPVMVVASAFGYGINNPLLLSDPSGNLPCSSKCTAVEFPRYPLSPCVFVATGPTLTKAGCAAACIAAKPDGVPATQWNARCALMCAKVSFALTCAALGRLCWVTFNPEKPSVRSKQLLEACVATCMSLCGGTSEGKCLG